MKINNNHILAVLVIVLAIVCVISITTPIRFESQQEKREKVVKERLIRIRHAEERFKNSKGVYAEDFRLLIKSGLLADSLQYVPFSGGTQFSLMATMYTTKSGRQLPLMECGTTYDEYLKGLDKKGIANLIDKATNMGKYPGLKIGDITKPNDNAGNWE
ncbi:MAG: hypothetical protein LUC91_09305 [Prevotella sp.]|nr:hypothetical protein [Prevotella sp.]